jgi:hypothetical protein
MDKVKVFLGHLKKHHFWVLTGIVLIVALAGWQMATAQLSEEYAANVGKIKAQFDTVTRITQMPQHPNEKFEEGTKLVTLEVKRDVARAWARVYNEQKQKVLKWPTELGPDFLQWIEDPSHATATIPEELRERYLNYVKNEFPRLLEVVDARPFYEEDAAGGAAMPGRNRGGFDEGGPAVGPGGQPLAPVKEYRVNWDKRNQEAIDRSLEFAEGTPDSMAVRFCQENLWVYHALLDSIAFINKDATGNHNAKIKDIISLDVGQDASAALIESLANGRILLPEGATAPAFGAAAGLEGAAPPAAAAPSRMMDDEGMGGRSPGVGGLGGSNRPRDDQRYVDDKGVPIPTGGPAPAEFKRMPIVMRLFMDQREIAALLVRLANSPLPVEIRQLRMNTKMQGFNNPRPVIFGGKEGAVDIRKGAAAMMRDKNMEEAILNPYDVGVELHGIIYIFNPPDQTLRGTDGPSGSTIAADPTATPAAEPAPAVPSSETPAAAEAAPAAPTNTVGGNTAEPKAASIDQANPATETPPAAADPTPATTEPAPVKQ